MCTSCITTHLSFIVNFFEVMELQRTNRKIACCRLQLFKQIEIRRDKDLKTTRTISQIDKTIVDMTLTTNPSNHIFSLKQI